VTETNGLASAIGTTSEQIERLTNHNLCTVSGTQGAQSTPKKAPKSLYVGRSATNWSHGQHIVIAKEIDGAAGQD
jgi:hypothetical protein